MKSKKLTGSFYTPKAVADFLVNRIATKLIETENVSILEPSAGDGVFISAFYSHPTLSKKIKKVVAVEKEKKELNKIQSNTKDKSFKAYGEDFLRFQADNKSSYRIVIGNPPYIKKNFLKKYQIAISEGIHKEAGLSANKLKNIWTAFLVRCIKFVDKDGILAFILPSELLQVKFASELRQLLLKEFERIEIFTFNELLFQDCKGQDTIILLAERKSDQKGIYYSNIDSVANLANNNFQLLHNINIRESKWNHHHLSSEEIELLERLKKRLQKIDHYCSSKAGIVTGANDFFIVDNSTVEEYSLHNYIKPIVQKGAFVNGSVTFSIHDFKKLVSGSKPAYLLALNKDSKFRTNQKISKYLRIGEDLNVHKGHKTGERDKWYEVPNVGFSPEAFFFKRSHEYPKLIINKASVLATDSAYIISMKEQFELESLIYSFYNSLTLSFAELEGRYYGGGVLELTPNEFKAIRVPYAKIDKVGFNTFTKNFADKSSIKEICRSNDTAILKSVDRAISNENIETIFNIREKLYMHRIKTR